MPVNAKATQEFVPIKEVRDNILILKDGSMRAILMTSSLNFALKSEENQEAIILQFQNLLNSLDFSIQIVIQSRRFDIRPYLLLLEERYKVQMSDLLKIQTREYIEFIRSFADSTNIMTKSFFVVVPYAEPALETKAGIKGISDKLLGGRKEPSAKEEASTERFEEARSQLEQRIAVVEQGLIRSGLRTVRLGTEEVVELFYKIFNPGETERSAAVKK